MVSFFGAPSRAWLVHSATRFPFSEERRPSKSAAQKNDGQSLSFYFGLVISSCSIPSEMGGDWIFSLGFDSHTRINRNSQTISK